MMVVTHLTSPTLSHQVSEPIAAAADREEMDYIAYCNIDPVETGWNGNVKAVGVAVERGEIGYHLPNRGVVFYIDAAYASKSTAE